MFINAQQGDYLRRGECEMTNERSELLRGAVVAAVTPATPDYNVDYDRFREHIRFIIEGGIGEGTGVLLLAGGGGEGYFLDDEQWRKVVAIGAEEARGEVPTAAGVFELSTMNAIDKIRFAEERGIDFIQLAPPHYLTPSQDEIYTHYKMVNDAISRIGICLYNTSWSMPCAQPTVTMELAEKVADLEHVVGVKWSSPSLGNLVEILTAFSDRFVFIDGQVPRWTVLSALRGGDVWGMKAFMSWLGNWDPESCANIAQLFLEGKYRQYAEAYIKHGRFHGDVVKALGFGKKPILGEGTLGKAKMELVGRPCGPPFPPQAEPTEAEWEELKKVARKYGFTANQTSWQDATLLLQGSKQICGLCLRGIEADFSPNPRVADPLGANMTSSMQLPEKRVKATIHAFGSHPKNQ
jgi:4-hydroxy-tetrahydrodipicolinate synthase